MQFDAGIVHFSHFVWISFANWRWCDDIWNDEIPRKFIAFHSSFFLQCSSHKLKIISMTLKWNLSALIPVFPFIFKMLFTITVFPFSCTSICNYFFSARKWKKERKEQTRKTNGIGTRINFRLIKGKFAEEEPKTNEKKKLDFRSSTNLVKHVTDDCQWNGLLHCQVMDFHIVCSNNDDDDDSEPRDNLSI